MIADIETRMPAFAQDMHALRANLLSVHCIAHRLQGLETDGALWAVVSRDAVAAVLGDLKAVAAFLEDIQALQATFPF